MRILKPAVALLFLLILAGGCGSQGTVNGTAAETDTSRVLATVGELNITEQMVAVELERIPPYQRAAFESPEGRRMLIDHLVEQELLLAAAADLGLEEDSFVVAQVELAMEQVENARKWALIQVFYQQEVVESVVVPEEDILEYYEEHSDDIYHQEQQIKLAHIMVTTPEDVDVVSTALDSGTPFGEAASTLSAHLASAAEQGNLGWVTVNSPMPYLGSQPELSAILFDTPMDAVVGPYETELGYHFFMVTDLREDGARPLEEVRESIENVLKPALVNSYLQDELLPQLMVDYGVSIDEQAFLPDENMPADSLLQSAQNLMETNPEGAIRYFDLFIERFPTHERAHQAQFLIGFTLSEQMGDYDRAAVAFQNVIDNYPESDFADDAAWMIENMGVPPETIIFEETETDSAV